MKITRRSLWFDVIYLTSISTKWYHRTVYIFAIHAIIVRYSSQKKAAVFIKLGYITAVFSGKDSLHWTGVVKINKSYFFYPYFKNCSKWDTDDHFISNSFVKMCFITDDKKQCCRYQADHDYGKQGRSLTFINPHKLP